MKVVLAILLNGALLAVLLPWLRRQWQEVGGWMRTALVIGLGARLAVAIATGRHLVHDAGYMSHYGQLLTAQLWAEPVAAFRTLWSDELHYAGDAVVFHGMSNTFLFIKIVAFLDLGSLSTNWVNAIYFSLFSFAGCWQLSRALAKAFPQTPAGAGVLAFVLWPSVIFWASGVTKESMVLGSGAWMLALFIDLFFGIEKHPKWQQWLWSFGLAVMMLVHFKMRYFFAAPILGALIVLALVRLLQRFGLACGRWLQVVVMVGVLSAGAWLASEVNVAFRVNKFTNQVMRNYGHNVAASVGKPHFEYSDLQPTTESIVRHMPQAVANALTRPWLGESKEWLYVAAGFENVLLLLLLAVALLAAWQGKSGRLPFGLGLVLVVHCLVLAVLLGLSTPNLGSLHRYRSGLLPYLVLLLLQNEYMAVALCRLGMRNENAEPQS